ncbi:Lipid phosphate phosphatase [Lachnellula hyalina]|uniref:Lipid phosphate phosphatase n=1 Tax=Lachnellula hyalina TaxID=1316788 RepID=A0A8H8TWB2_9HELO|nr:Lipid phosphate phosphatase [Lachnellula hyalina]TVY24699.1 Lipid phosphate phosphatase [Lachnellula hyalina]
MGLLSRFQRNNTTDLASASNTHATSFGSHTRKDPLVTNMSQRPTFRRWFTVTWLDLVTMAIIGAIGLGVSEAHPAASRSFPIYFQDGEIVYPQFAYPMRNEIVPIWAATVLALAVPIAVFLICQIRVRSFWDLNNAIIGLEYSLIAASVFQVFIKWLIGGLRSHFLAVCKPNVPVQAAQETGNGLRQIMYDRRVCTGNQKQIDDSLESFPSGHSTAAFAGFVFLSLYLNAKLKLWSNYHPDFWKLIAIWAPILGATLIAGALTIDEYHNWYDCLAGAIIGTVMALSAYRMVYASIWDWRTNHIPLNRAVPFNGARPELEHSVFTRQAGWGDASKHAGGENQAAGHGLQVGPVANEDYGQGQTSGVIRKPLEGTGNHARADPGNLV